MDVSAGGAALLAALLLLPPGCQGRGPRGAAGPGQNRVTVTVRRVRRVRGGVSREPAPALTAATGRRVMKLKRRRK